MGFLGISFILASVVYLAARQTGYFPAWFAQLKQVFGSSRAITDGSNEASRQSTADATSKEKKVEDGATTTGLKVMKDTVRRRADSLAMPPPPVIEPPTIFPPTIQPPDEQTTPKATAAAPSNPIPTFSLSDSLSPAMPPPPRPPRLSQFPAPNSAQRARGPAPNRTPGLAPPPTLSAKPTKPSRKVLLTPGHSPLDWARVSSDPTQNLNGLPAGTAYIRVTPSMLKQKTGRKGKEGWMALNGKVYNVGPYADFHPGGVPELMRAAGKDGTRLFGEIHPWVNYETMLQSCLVGLLVEEPVAGEVNEMDQMD